MNLADYPTHVKSLSILTTLININWIFKYKQYKMGRVGKHEKRK